MIAVVLTRVGFPRDQIHMATEAAFIPMWFLAVYLLVTACTPLTMKAWKRLGWISFVIYIPLVLGIVQVELVLALEPLSRRMLDSVRIWTATVLMNGMIVTVYL